MKKKVILLSSLLLLSTGHLATARSVDKIKEDIDKTKTELSELMIELKNEEGRENWKLDDLVELENGILITVNNISIDTPEARDKFEHNMVRVDFTIDNQSDKPVKYNAHDFSFYDGDRTKTSHVSKKFFTETIDPRMKADGTIYYDVKTLGDTTLSFEGNQWTLPITE